MKIPEIVRTQYDELVNAIDESKRRSLTTEEVAAIFGMDKTKLRVMAEKGKCPFALAVREHDCANLYVRYPAIALFAWATAGEMFKEA